MTMNTSLRFSLAAVLAPAMLSATQPRQKPSNPLMPFVENRGQIADASIRFHASTFAGPVCVKDDGTLVYILHGDAGDPGFRAPAICVIAEKMAGGAQAAPSGAEKAAAFFSVFKGVNPADWHAAIPAWSRISIPGADSRVRLDVTAHSSTVEKIFSLRPGADPESIRMTVLGAESLSIDDSGSLVVRTKLGSISFSAPKAWQETPLGREPVEAAYWAENGDYGFLLGAYDTARTVHIDPLLASTYLGGSKWDSCVALAVDSSGCVYVTGTTRSGEFPTTPGAYNIGPAIGALFISKFDPGLSTLLASTLMYGSGSDSPADILLDGQGSVYITGSTTSTNFPVTPGAYCRTFQGSEYDVFVSRLNTDLTTLVDSTYLGGSEYEWGNALARTAEGNIVCAGATRSEDFPTTGSAFQRKLCPNNMQSVFDAFVAVFDSSLSALAASTYLGGSNFDGVEDVCVDSYGAIRLAGSTGGQGFPIRAGAAQPIFGGGDFDAFVTTMDGGLQTVVSSTFVGGASNDTAYAILMDGSDYLYIGGDTASSNFPVTAYAYDNGPQHGAADAFICRLNAGLGNIRNSTLLGGADYDSCQSLARSAYGHIYAAGNTASGDFPATARAFQKALKESDGFIALLSPDLGALEAATFFGGTSYDYIYDLALDKHGKVFFAGYTESYNLPVTPGAFDMWYDKPDLPWHGDGYVAKLDANLSEQGHPFNDYNNDGLSDMAVYNPAGGLWYVESFWGEDIAWAEPWGWDGASLCPGEFNGDHCWDMAVFDGLSGGWFVRSISGGVVAWGVPWGWPGAIPVTTDFDGDGINELTVYDNNNGLWYSMTVGGTVLVWADAWGWPGAAVVPGDYNADGCTEMAVFDSATGCWYVKSPAPQGTILVWAFNWGWPGAVPVPGDFNGDRAADFAVYDRSQGTWFIMCSSGVIAAWNDAWGWSGAQAVPGDYDGDMVSDLAVYDLATGNWYVKSVAHTPSHAIMWGRNSGFAGAVPVGGR